ncbi:uncharacterized protein [Amphiura filiformis]|uniref:uncharacterized protein n=1 Tax=Amphiura filiformis TaxID=82378 RepID=UPI003B20C654
MASAEVAVKSTLLGTNASNFTMSALEENAIAGYSSTEDSDDTDDEIKPSIADQQKVGFFSQDRATQTIESEIVNLKEMTDVLQTLLKESKSLKRELVVTKQVMEAEYENKLQEKALDMYCRINERVDELQKRHAERVEIVRRSFRQQLADSISKLNNDWKKHAGRKMQAELSAQAGRSQQSEESVRQMQQQVTQQEGVIQMLRMQLEQLALAPRSEPSTPSAVYEAEHLREELSELQNKIDNLEEALDTKDEITEELNRDLERVNKDLEKERIQIKQLLKELEQAKASATHEMASMKRNAEKQRLALEREMQTKVSKAKDEMLGIAKKHAAEQQKQEEEKLRILQEKKKTEAALNAKEASNAESEAKSGDELARLRKLERHFRNEVLRLKREITRSTKMWEKKFSIMQKSMYALKDESYVRQTLQKQAAALHHASVSYSSDVPVGILPTSQVAGSAPKKPPLPGIGHAPMMKTGRDPRDLISPFTMSPPPGRGVELFSTEPSQIVDPSEDFDADTEILPLPTPPPPRFQDSRPSSTSQVIVLPTA